MTDCEDASEEVLSAIGISDATITVTPTTIVENTPEVTVDCSLTLSANHGFVFTSFIVGKTINTTCNMQREMIQE